MSYTPINWQTGDTITAEKLNKMDNGWGYEFGTQLFSETVTTSAGGGFVSGSFTYSSKISNPVITVTFNGTDYDCSRIDASGVYYYGGFGEQGPDFSTYPFCIMSGAMPGNETIINMIYTETAGTYTITVSTALPVVSGEFKTVVESITPLLCIPGISTQEEMGAAYSDGRILYFFYSGNMYIITSFNSSRVGFMPSASLTASFNNGIFVVTTV